MQLHRRRLELCTPGQKPHHSGMTKPVAERRAKYSNAWATACTSWLACASSRSSPNSTFVVIRSVCALAEWVTSLSYPLCAETANNAQAAHYRRLLLCVHTLRCGGVCTQVRDCVILAAFRTSSL